jgi:NitT/TauT family transport system permease protein
VVESQLTMRLPAFFGVHAAPSPWMGRLLVLAPFVLLIAVYLVASHLRLSENPDDKILPSIAQMADAVDRLAFTRDPRSDEFVMLQDTLSSLKRLALGIGLAAVSGLLLGMNMALFPGMGITLIGIVTFVSIIPPLAILPILFITFGVDELAKVMLIFLGTFPLITRDIYGTVKAMPREQMTKALTLGADELQLAYRIILPQVMPRLIDTIRLTLGGGWLFLIAAEAIASTDGLGYRIFLVRRYLAMDVIIPYVLWITFLGYTIDWSLRQILRRRYRWYQS